MDNYYGETLKAIRLSKGLTQKEVYSGIVSRSFYVKFEKGESDISVTKFSKMLENLFLTFEEFMYIHNDHKNNQNLLYNRIIFFWKEKMYEELYEFYKSYYKSKFYNEHFLSLLAYCLLYYIKKEEWDLNYTPIDELKNTFATKKSFTLKEIETSRFLINHLSWEDTDKLLNKALSSLKKYKRMDTNEYARLFTQIGLIKVQHLISKGKEKSAYNMLEEMEFEMEAAHDPESFLNYKTAEIVLGLFSDKSEWIKEADKFKEVMAYIDPCSWTENIAIIDTYTNYDELEK